jgi:hypothetical protein
VIGAQLDAEGAVNAGLVLRHEQYHIRLGCAIAIEANALISKGADPKSIRRRVIASHNKNRAAAEKESMHGCDTPKQAAWEIRIDNVTSRWFNSQRSLVGKNHDRVEVNLRNRNVPKVPLSTG